MNTLKLPSNISILPRALLTIGRKKNHAVETTSMQNIFITKSIDINRLAKYRRLFEANHSNIPLTFFYFLSQPAQIGLMLNKRFPFPIPGLVHTNNKLSLIQEPNLSASWQIHTRLNILPADVNNHCEVVFESDLQQSGRIITTCQSTYLLLNKRSKKKGKKIEQVNEELVNSNKVVWSLSNKLGRHYASVSGDYNPIHLYKMTAKLFGFKRAIIQGMYSNSRIVSDIEGHFGKPIKNIQISFLKPVFLPKKIILEFNSLDKINGAFQLLSMDRETLFIKGNYKL